MSRKSNLEVMLDEALELCEKYEKNIKMLIESHRGEREAANQVINTQKVLIETQKEKIELLEERVQLLEENIRLLERKE